MKTISATTWKQRADAHLGGLKRGTKITADDVVFKIGVPKARSVVGGWFTQQFHAGHLQGTGQFVISERTDRRGGSQQIWVVT